MGNSDPYSRARTLYHRHLEAASSDPLLARLASDALARGIPVQARRAGRVLKMSDGNAAGLIFKFYAKHRHFDRWRPSRAKMAFAASRTLQELGIRSVEVVGFVDSSPEITPFDSCLVMREQKHAITLRDWLRKYHRQMDRQSWSAWRNAVFEAWIGLGRNGLYHDDTKALNLLTNACWSPVPQFLAWIDFESIRAGYRPGMRSILRNLAQLNGSLRKWVPDEERIAFLRQAAAEYPWLAQPWVPCLLRWWTQRRLRHEVRTRCGP